MATSIKTMTAEQLWRMPSNEMRHELVNGELRTMPPAGAEHGAIVVKLTRLLANHVEAGKLGMVFGAETGFILSQNPDNVRGADISFICQARIPATIPKTYWPGAPDLAVEVLSPSDTVEEIEEKIAEYLESGCSLVWVINPKRKTVSIHKQGVNPTIVQSDGLLDGQVVVPGFQCKVADIFV